MTVYKTRKEAISAIKSMPKKLQKYHKPVKSLRWKTVDYETMEAKKIPCWMLVYDPTGFKKRFF